MPALMPAQIDLSEWNNKIHGQARVNILLEVVTEPFPSG